MSDESGDLLKSTEFEVNKGSKDEFWEISVSALDENRTLVTAPKKSGTEVFKEAKSDADYPVALMHNVTYIPPESRSLGESNTHTIRLWISASPQIFSQIDRVTYYLHSSFKSPIVSRFSPDDNFALTLRVWGSFDIKAKVYFKDNQVQDLSLPGKNWNILE